MSEFGVMLTRKQVESLRQEFPYGETLGASVVNLIGQIRELAQTALALMDENERLRFLDPEQQYDRARTAEAALAQERHAVQVLRKQRDTAEARADANWQGWNDYIALSAKARDTAEARMQALEAKLRENGIEP